MRGLQRNLTVLAAVSAAVVALVPVTVADAVTLPSVRAVTPRTGTTLGGERVSVTGTGFAHVTAVLFGSSSGSSVHVASSTSLTVIAPRRAAGAVNVRVVTLGGTTRYYSSITSLDRFTYYAPPVISSVSPASGPDIGGSLVTVTGSGFLLLHRVLFGNVAGTGLSVASSSKLTVRAPAAVGGTVNVRVVGGYGTSPVTSADRFSFVPTSRVYGWGEDDRMQLGDGQTTFEPAPTYLPLLAGARQVLASGQGGMALMSDGTVKSWSINGSGAIGDGTVGYAPTPQTVPGMSGVTQIATGWGSEYALRADGTVWDWGYNNDGELGNGSIDTSGCRCNPTPAAIPGLTDVIGIAAAGDFALAIRADGSVWGWGSNQYGSLGTGDTAAYNPTPQQLPGLPPVSSVVASARRGYAVAADGSVWAWGCCGGAALGDGNTYDLTDTPVQVTGLSDIRSVSIGGGGTFALAADGTIYGWGDDELYHDGFYDVQHDRPISEPQLTGFVHISGADSSNFGIKSDGTVWAWGSNSLGELGLGYTTSTTTNGCYCVTAPTQLPSLTQIASLDTSSLWTFALRDTP